MEDYNEHYRFIMFFFEVNRYVLFTERTLYIYIMYMSETIFKILIWDHFRLEMYSAPNGQSWLKLIE